MIFTLKKTKRETGDTVSYIFMPENPLRWKAGQYLHYTLNHPHPDDRGVERYFSIASAPHEKYVMVTTRFAPKSSSFKKALKNSSRVIRLKPTDWVAISLLMIAGKYSCSSPGESASHHFAPSCWICITTGNH